MKTTDTLRPDEIKSWERLPLTLTPADIAAVLGISRESVYDLLLSNSLPTVKIGKRRRVPRESLRRWLEG